VLISTLVIGLGLSIVQSATQIQESTLTFLPKLVVGGARPGGHRRLVAAGARELHPGAVHDGAGAAEHLSATEGEMNGLQLAAGENLVAAFLLAVARTAGFVMVSPPSPAAPFPAG
jgi:hypothetical protein